MSEIKLLTDNPLFESTLEDDDGLKFNEYTNILKNAALNTDTPFTIGVFGEWGKGKTTFLNMIKTKISEEEKYKEKTLVTVWFNAWKYEKDKDPLIALLIAITDALSVHPNYKEAAKDLSKGIFKFLTTLTINLLEKTKIKETLKDLKDDEKEKHEVIDKVLKQNSYIEIFKEFEAFEAAIEDENIRLFIFIDDLDRCHPNNAVKLLENIKLVLDLKNFTFIMGIANEIIEGHLDHRYEKTFGLPEGKNHGKLYLDKLIQLPFKLPKFNKKFDSLVSSLFTKTNITDDIETIKEVINSVAGHGAITPRMLIRIINQAKVHSEINKVLEDNNRIEDIDVFALFVFSLLFDNLYEKMFSILETERPSNYSKLHEISSSFKKLNEEDENYETELSDFISKIEISSESKEGFNGVLLKYKEDKIFRNILKTTIAIKWLNDIKIREKTFEFIDETNSTTEEEKTEKQKLILDGLTLDEIKNKLEEEINQSTKVVDYKKFIPVVNADNLNDKNFEFSKFLVTNKWYKEEFKTTHNSGDKFDTNFQPVVNVSWNDANDFCEYLTNHEDNIADDNGKKWKYSLPSQKQFVYLASNKNTTKYPWGDDWDNTQCNNSDINLEKTSIVGSFSPSGDTQDGICDMSGNVWKWTSDDSKEYKGRKVLTGGSWNDSVEDYFAASFSNFNIPGYRGSNIGFFLTRTK